MNTNHSMDKPVFIHLRPHNLKELCALYGVCRLTFRKWLKPFEKEIGVRNGMYYSVLQVQVIFNKLGYPAMYDINPNLAA